MRFPAQAEHHFFYSPPEIAQNASCKHRTNYNQRINGSTDEICRTGHFLYNITYDISTSFNRHLTQPLTE